MNEYVFKLKNTTEQLNVWLEKMNIKFLHPYLYKINDDSQLIKCCTQNINDTTLKTNN